MTGSPSRGQSSINSDATSNESKKDPLDRSSSSNRGGSGQGMIKWGTSSNAGSGEAARASTPNSGLQQSTQRDTALGLVQWCDLEPRPIEEMIARPLTRKKGNQEADTASENKEEDGGQEATGANVTAI